VKRQRHIAYDRQMKKAVPTMTAADRRFMIEARDAYLASRPLTPEQKDRWKSVFARYPIGELYALFGYSADAPGAFDRDPELANAQAWASERGRCPGLVKCNVGARNAVLPWAFTQHVVSAFDAGAKKLEFDIDVWANGRASPSSTPYRWLIVSRVDGKAFRLKAGRPMTVSPREVLRPL
jgi:hypothetical protein